MTDDARPERSHPYRQAFITELTASVADFLDQGVQLPLDSHTVRLAVDSTYVRGTLRLARRDRRPVLAWLLRRYLKQFTV